MIVLLYFAEYYDSVYSLQSIVLPNFNFLFQVRLRMRDYYFYCLHHEPLLSSFIYQYHSVLICAAAAAAAVLAQNFVIFSSL